MTPASYNQRNCSFLKALIGCHHLQKWLYGDPHVMRCDKAHPEILNGVVLT